MGLGMKSEMLVSPAEGVLDWEPQLSCPTPELLVRRGGSPPHSWPRYCSTTDVSVFQGSMMMYHKRSSMRQNRRAVSIF